jgi:alpha-L-fucosidase
MPRPWGVTTQEGDRVFVHVLDWKDAVLALPKPKRAVKSAALFGAHTPVRFTVDKDSLLLHLDPSAFDPIDTIVVLELGK